MDKVVSAFVRPVCGPEAAGCAQDVHAFSVTRVRHHLLRLLLLQNRRLLSHLNQHCLFELSLALVCGSGNGGSPLIGLH